MNIVLGIAIIMLCILCEGFFAGSEIGIISCNRIKMSSLVDKKDRRAKIIISFLESPERFLSTTLIGVNLSVIAASSVATAMVSGYIKAPGKDILIATILVWPLVLIFGETIPKIIYRQHADFFTLLSAYPLKAASLVFSPFLFLVAKISSLISKAFSKGDFFKKDSYVTREEIRLLLIEAAKDGILDKSQIDMAGEIFDFGRTAAWSVMVPLGNVISASDISTTNDILELITESGYSRIPVYSGREDNIIGTVEASDFVRNDIGEKELKTLIRMPYKVEETKILKDVLKDFQNNQKSMAIVIDKDGRAVGIVTQEDVVEEIVGEIEDEYEVAT